MTKLAIFATLAAGSLPVSAVTLFAGWDAFTATEEQTSPATILAPDTIATLAGTDGSTATGNAWSDWNNGNQGASTDGTFGDLSTTVASASLDGGPGGSGGDAVNLSLSRQHKPGSLIITLTNTSGTDRILNGFYFDGANHNSQAARQWDLSYAGAISGTPSNGTFNIGDMMAVAHDWSVDLTGLSDNVWEAGGDAIFTLTFTGGSPATGTGGGHELVIDNIGITATPVPEPSTLALFGLGGLALFLRRRK